MWIDLHRNKHENMKIFESRVTYRNHRKRHCTAEQNDSAQCDCASVIGLSVDTMGAGMEYPGIEGYTWAQQHELLLIEADLATACVKCPNYQ